MPKSWSLRDGHVSIPAEKEAILKRIWQTSGTTACFDVFAWKDSELLFCEAKRLGKDNLTDAQLRFIEGALACGMGMSAFGCIAQPTRFVLSEALSRPRDSCMRITLSGMALKRLCPSSLRFACARLNLTLRGDRAAPLFDCSAGRPNSPNSPPCRTLSVHFWGMRSEVEMPSRNSLILLDILVGAQGLEPWTR
jgi:hypothetical protein